MNAGVSTTPCGVSNQPSRAAPCSCEVRKTKSDIDERHEYCVKRLRLNQDTRINLSGRLLATSATPHRLPLSDDLSVDRTTLANERTFLAYARTALHCVVGGVSLMKFFDHAYAVVLGWIFLVSGVIAAVTGSVVFVRAGDCCNGRGEPAVAPKGYEHPARHG